MPKISVGDNKNYRWRRSAEKNKQNKNKEKHKQTNNKKDKGMKTLAEGWELKDLILILS